MFNTLLERETRRNGKERFHCAEAVEQQKFLWKQAEKRGEFPEKLQPGDAGDAEVFRSAE
jgi:hypothetical protein